MRQDIRRRLVPTLAAATALLLCALCVHAVQFAQAMQARRVDQLALRGRLHAAGATLDEAQSFIRNAQPALAALAAQGVIGLPPRLRLLASLQALAMWPGLLALEWELGPAVPREIPAGAPKPAFEVLASSLALRLSLAAPEALPPLLASLREAAGGLSVVRSCQLDRRDDGQVDARCELVWLSVPLPGAGGAT